MHLRVAAAILLIDGFTGLPIQDVSVLLEMEDKSKPIRKPDGYFVFLHHGNMCPKLTVGGGIYEKRMLSIDINAVWQKKRPDLKLYLTPGKQYPFPSGIKWQTMTIKETAQTEAAAEALFIPAVWEMTKGVIKLSRDYDGAENTICLKSVSGFPIEGRLLAFRNKDGAVEKTGRIWDTIDSRNGLYRLDMPMKVSWSCRETDVYLIYEAKADENGSYKIPVSIGGD